MHVGDNIEADSTQWTFAGDVANIFDEHIAKSVPLYHHGHDLIISLSDYFIRAGSVCYDIGSSTGTLAFLLAKRHQEKDNVLVIGLEKEEDMVSHAQQRHSLGNLEFHCADIIDSQLESSSFVVAYYALQFIKTKHRRAIIKKIYDSLETGGAFIFYEKVYAVNAHFQEILSGAHFDFKASNGFSHDEILAKALSIKGVLMPNTTRENIDLLKSVGFKEMSRVMQHCNFEGYLAIK